MNTQYLMKYAIHEINYYYDDDDDDDDDERGKEPGLLRWNLF